MVSVTATGDNPLCGDSIRVFIEVDGDRVMEAQWEGYGCDLCLKSTDEVIDRIAGLNSNEISILIQKDLRDLLENEDIGRTRKKCVMLSLEAVRKALSLA